MGITHHTSLIELPLNETKIQENKSACQLTSNICDNINDMHDRPNSYDTPGKNKSVLKKVHFSEK